MQTLFAKIVNFRLTPTELVLEFGSFFPDRPNVAPPADFKPDIRVVLNAGALPGLVQALTNAATQQRQGQAAAKPTPGFTQ
jgi:hypothetical protein